MMRILSPHQIAAVEQLLYKNRALLVNPTRTGKTLISLTLIKTWNPSHLLVVVPLLALKTHWENELSRAGLFLMPIKVIHVAALDKYLKTKPTHDCIIVDESHYLKKPTAARSKALFSLCEKARRVLLLTATPFTTEPAENFVQLQMLGVFGTYKYKNYAKFLNSFVATKIVRIKGGRLIRTYTIFFKDGALEKVKDLYKDFIVSTIEPSLKNFTFKYLKSNFFLIKHQSHFEQLEYLAQARIDCVLETFTLGELRNMVIFVKHIETAEYLKSIYYTKTFEVPFVLTSRHVHKNYLDYVEKWKKSNQPLICTYRIAGAGIDLRRKGLKGLVMLETYGSFAHTYQALSRVQSFDQDAKQTVYFFKCGQSVEKSAEKINKLYLDKMDKKIYDLF